MCSFSVLLLQFVILNCFLLCLCVAWSAGTEKKILVSGPSSHKKRLSASPNHEPDQPTPIEGREHRASLVVSPLPSAPSPAAPSDVVVFSPTDRVFKQPIPDRVIVSTEGGELSFVSTAATTMQSTYTPQSTSPITPISPVMGLHYHVCLWTHIQRAFGS